MISPRWISLGASLGLACVIACGPGVDGGSSQGESAATGNSTATSAGADCDPFPSDGEPCSMPGTYCSGDCSDQCQFCNVLECRDGAWSMTEVFPLRCLECDEVCVRSVAAGCSAGAPDQAACVMGCEDIMAGPCSLEFSDARACIGETPTFTCDANGRPIVVGCEDDFTALYACLGI